MNFAFDEYELDSAGLELKRGGAPLRADRMVLRLLGALVQAAGELVTKDELMARVWERRAVSRNVITVAMTRLRKTLGQQAGVREYVVSVQGRGYRFVRPVHSVAPRGVAAPREALFGRELALCRLRRALAAAAGGRGGACLLTGEPGIGKTALAEQLSAEAAQRGMRVVWSYCQEVGETPPLWPFAQLAQGTLEHGAHRAPELRWLLGGAREAAPPARHRLFETVLDALERAAGPTGCMLVIEDLQRADPASRELLRYWMARLARSRVLVVATLRTGTPADDDDDLRSVLGHRNGARVGLARLEPPAVQAYLTRVLPGHDPALAATVWSESEGNPFVMVELVRQLTDAGALARHGLRELQVEGPALELWRAPLHALDADLREVLACAAVIGRRFELCLLQQLTGRKLDALRTQLDAAVASGAVLPPAEGETAFVFGHALIRRLLCDELTPSARWTLRRKLADALAAHGLQEPPS